MALTVTVNDTVTPVTLTAVSDRRIVQVIAAGDTANAVFPVHINDASGRTWTVVSDDGKTAVYHG